MKMDLNKERIDILTQAAEGRAREVMHYQINIDNYVRAIAEIEKSHADDADMQAFADHLRNLLKSSRVEQAKEKLLLKVIQDQLGE